MKMRTYRRGHITVIPVETLKRRALFDGIGSPSYPLGGTNEREWIASSTREIIRRLRVHLPEAIPETADLSERQCPNVYAATYYVMPLTNGRVEAEVTVSEDLGKDIRAMCRLDGLEEDGISEVEGVSGVLITTSYFWGGNNGRGLQLGRYSDYPFSVSSNDATAAFGAMLNALCRGDRRLSEDVIRIDRRERTHPLRYYDGITSIPASLSVVTAEAFERADRPVSELMEWMQSNAVDVNTAGEYVRLVVGQRCAIKGHEGRVRAGEVREDLVKEIARISEDYFRIAQELFARLNPPENNRMLYLVE